MSFFEWAGLTFIMIGLFIGLLYAFKSADSKKNKIENSYNSKNEIDDGEYNDDNVRYW